jgi:eukaryotic-like serine/threonine-protein kinase
VEYAHQQGVFHRDLKPANVILGPDNSPVLMDFSLARLSEGDSQMTLAGHIVGTPSYLPPERANGETMTTDDVSGDVYGLGAILYHMLTGSPPFLGESISATLEALVQRDPVSPRQLRPGLHRDLETICLKCLRKDPAARYATASAVAADLGRYIAGEAIEAAPESGYLKALRWLRRRPGLALLAAALVASLVIGIVGMRYQTHLARVSQAQAELAAKTLRQELYSADIFAASIALKNNNIGKARRLLAAHLPMGKQEDIRGFEWHYLLRSCQGTEAAILEEHQHMITGLG